MRIRRLSALVLLIVLIRLPVRTAEAQRTEADVYVGQAIVEFDDKRYDAALENLRKALEVEPDHIQALYYSGVVYIDRKSTRLNSSHGYISYAVFCLKKKKQRTHHTSSISS